MRRLSRVLLTTALASVGYLTIAHATPVFTSGGGLVQVKNVSDTEVRTTTSIAYVNFTSLGIVIPAGSTRLVSARFTAESQCSGNNEGRCTVRIRARNRTSGSIVDLNPASGFDYIFDTDQPFNNDDLWESRSVERSARLSAGTWDVSVQWATIGGTTIFSLDDWHFRVEVFQ